VGKTDRDRERVDVRVRVDVRRRPRRRVRMPGLCPKCERWFPVMRDGNLQPHQLDDMALCPGSGEPPTSLH
jgi:hypothetical protein